MVDLLGRKGVNKQLQMSLPGHLNIDRTLRSPFKGLWGKSKNPGCQIVLSLDSGVKGGVIQS